MAVPAAVTGMGRAQMPDRAENPLDGKKRRRWRIFGALLVAGVLAAWLAGERLTYGLCGNTVLSEVASPNGFVTAVVFQRDCGATTAFSTQVSVVVGPWGSVTRLPSESGNVAVFGNVPVSVEWRSNREFVIRGSGHRYKARQRHLWVRVGC